MNLNECNIEKNRTIIVHLRSHSLLPFTFKNELNAKNARKHLHKPESMAFSQFVHWWRNPVLTV